VTEAREVLGPAELQATVARLGRELSDAYDDGVVLVGVLKGGVVFLADLVRQLTIVPHIDFLAVSPYTPGTGRVRIVKDLDTDLVGRDVVLVDDAVDTGLTTSYLLGELGRRKAASVEVCALVDKRARRLVPVPIRFSGVAVDDEYLVGYGLGHRERWRNLDRVLAVDESALDAGFDPRGKR
jgi:hypoxanthine phosphoribosyltransferase